MTTIINTPNSGGDDGSVSTVLLIGIILALVLGGLFLYYGIPALKNTNAQPNQKTEIKVVVPTPEPVATTPAPTN